MQKGKIGLIFASIRMRSGVVVKCVGAPLNESILKRDP